MASTLPHYAARGSRQAKQQNADRRNADRLVADGVLPSTNGFDADGWRETHLTDSETAEFNHLEKVIEHGLKAFREAGMALKSIRDNRLYRQYYKTFEEYCDVRWQVTPQHAGRLIAAATVTNNLEPIGSIPTNEAQARPLAELQPDEQRIVWEVVQQTAPSGKVTAAHVKSVATVFKEVVATGAIDDGSGTQIAVSDVVKAAITEETYERMMRQQAHIEEKLAQKNGTHSVFLISDNNEWYTPAPYIEAAHKVLGGIDTDPASNDIANRIVKAHTYYTLQTDGFDKEWRGRVFLNPPYGRDDNGGNQERWSQRLIEQYHAGITTEAILLVNAVTDRAWFRPLWEYPICFTDHRIRFYDEKGEFGQPTHGNAFVYLGEHPGLFADVFRRFGPVVLDTVRKVLP